jgi:hypothetical protein
MIKRKREGEGGGREGEIKEIKEKRECVCE